MRAFFRIFILLMYIPTKVFGMDIEDQDRDSRSPYLKYTGKRKLNDREISLQERNPLAVELTDEEEQGATLKLKRVSLQRQKRIKRKAQADIEKAKSLLNTNKEDNNKRTYDLFKGVSEKEENPLESRSIACFYQALMRYQNRVSEDMLPGGLVYHIFKETSDNPLLLMDIRNEARFYQAQMLYNLDGVSIASFFLCQEIINTEDGNDILKKYARRMQFEIYLNRKRKDLSTSNILKEEKEYEFLKWINENEAAEPSMQATAQFYQAFMCIENKVSNNILSDEEAFRLLENVSGNPATMSDIRVAACFFYAEMVRSKRVTEDLIKIKNAFEIYKRIMEDESAAVYLRMRSKLSQAILRVEGRIEDKLLSLEDAYKAFKDISENLLALDELRKEAKFYQLSMLVVGQATDRDISTETLVQFFERAKDERELPEEYRLYADKCLLHLRNKIDTAS